MPTDCGTSLARDFRGCRIIKPIVVTKDLTKTFATQGRLVHAVRDVTLEVWPGELFGLFGPNGAGKSTFIRMLSTLLAPTSGHATVNGHDIVDDDLGVRASLGLVASDERSFYGRLNARQNLWFYATLQNMPRGRIRERTDYVLGLFDLQHKADAPFQSLSTGQRQRLNMARALIHDPPILLLDEPTKSMDVQTSDFVKSLVKDELVGKQRKTVMFISHELYQMENFCDRVAVLAEGRLQAVGTPDELRVELPQRAVYRLKVEGDGERMMVALRSLPQIETVVEVSRGMALTSLDVTLVDETASAWLEVLEIVASCGGRVESYQRADDRSLREIVKYYSSPTEGQQCVSPS